MRPRCGAEFLHGGDGRFDHAGERAAPAGMRGADHAAPRASANRIGPQSAVDTPIASRATRVTMASARGPVLVRPWLVGDHDVGRMDLIGA